ncbi:MAG: electron transport complex subunit E [Ruminococcaceae bacterium]|nr:electron transport complex subunit E [Oscillospiraceae bacterium]
MKKNGFLFQMKKGILDENPVLVQLLGMCPTLALTTQVSNAIGMGLAATVVLICSNLLISLLRHIIPKQVRIAAFIVIISGFVTAVELLMKAYLFELYQSLGIFLSLIVVNCIILARAEAYASKNKPLPSAVDGLASGLGFTFALIIMAVVREVLGSGTILGYDITFGVFEPAMMIAQPAGAFITLGMIIAVVQKIKNRSSDKERHERLVKAEPKRREEVK